MERGDNIGQLFLVFSDGSHYELYGWLLDGAKEVDNSPTSRLCHLDGSKGHGSRAFFAEDDSQSRPSRPRASLGVTFRVPLLQILRERGGQAPRQVALRELEKRIGHELIDVDRAPLASGAARWEYNVVWEVRAMRKEKLLLPVDPADKEIWALAPEGMNLAESLHRRYMAFLARTHERASEY